MATGHKTGGRQKGVPNKATIARTKAIAESGLTPLDYLIGVMRNATVETSTRIDAAKSAAPYVHPRLTSVEMSGPEKGPVQFEDVSEDVRLEAFMAFLERTKK
jgi:hypothetical protein